MKTVSLNRMFASEGWKLGVYAAGMRKKKKIYKSQVTPNVPPSAVYNKSVVH